VFSRYLKTVKFGKETVKFQGCAAERTAGSAVQAMPLPDSDEGRRSELFAPPPSQAGEADLPPPAVQSAASSPRWAGSSTRPRTFGRNVPAAQRRTQPSGTTSALAGRPRRLSKRCFPTSLGSRVVTRCFAMTDALTPTGPCCVARRGSLIHILRISDPSVSNPLWFSTRRVPLPQRWPHYFVRASPFP
jgi:hypothetical protein